MNTADKNSKPLNNSLQILSTLINTIPHPAFFRDKDGVFVDCNAAFAEKILGTRCENIVGQSVFDLPDIIPQVLTDFCLENDKKLLDHPGIQTYEAAIACADGLKRDFLFSRASFSDHNGMIAGIVSVMLDLTDRIKFEAQLHQSQKMETIGQLAAGIAHEINTPTQFVGDNTRFLQDAFRDLVEACNLYKDSINAAKAGTLNPEHIQDVEAQLEELDIAYLEEEVPLAIEQTLKGVDRITHIVQAMKIYAHPGGDEKEPVDINKEIEKTITFTRNEWKYVADFKTDFDTALPTVPCHRAEFNQVILNLIVNAAHAIADANAENSTEKGIITIGTSQAENRAEIRISDTGAGIPEHIRHRIFDLFFTTKEPGRGTGQGLAIALSVIVDKHDGSIDIETKENKGTTFVIRLPIDTTLSGNE
ncbi:MAG: ATP-binding protein [Desulfobacterales bacterium]|jgi:PAS domain S-box-containing protein